MKPEAVEKAKGKLARANRAIAVIKAPDENDPTKAIEHAWEDFVMACSAFYSALEQGSKDNQKSRNWFGQKKGERRKDPLLQYLHQARNAEEHGIRRITAKASGEVTLKPGSKALVQNDGRAIRVIDSSGDVVFEETRVLLVAVYDDRFKDSFGPPTEHKGQKLTDRSPLAVAELAEAYLTSTLAEAEQLSLSTSMAK